MAADGSMPVAHSDARIPATSPRLRPQALLRVLDYIDAHLGENFSLEELASVVSVSRFHFARLFRASTGMSPMAFLLRTRVERARSLPVEADSSIAETAAALGFFDQSHFTRTFRRFTGRTPREFARAHRRGNGAVLPTRR